MGTVSNFIAEVIEIVVRNPQHLVRFKTTATNPFCPPKELKRMFETPGVVEEFDKANLVSSIEEDDFDICTVGVGYSDVVADRVRSYYATRSGLSIFLDVFKDTTTFIPAKDGFQIDGSRTPEYQAFLDNLVVGQEVQCTLFGIGIVSSISENCCENEFLKPGDKPVRIVTVDFGICDVTQRYGYYLEGHPISVAFIGNTLQPVKEQTS